MIQDTVVVTMEDE